MAVYWIVLIISAVLTGDGYTEFSHLLEQRGSVDYLFNRINEIEAEEKSSVKDSA